MKESVSAVFVTSSEVFFIKRQNYLSVFPGYYSTPGGKVDKSDSDLPLDHPIFPKHVSPRILNALIREIREELNFDLNEAINLGLVTSIDEVGVAITPEFNPYRFKNYYIKITLKKSVQFDIDKNEAEYGEWNTPEKLLNKYESGQILAVPPAVMLLRTFKNSILHQDLIDMTLPHNPELEVPMIESICGVRQFLPLSNTFPPANRTNSFIIGDHDQKKFLIDPSPKDEIELEKFLRSVDKIGFDAILLTHHHKDHYEFSNTIAMKYNVPIYLSEYTLNAIGLTYFKNIQTILVKEGEVLTKSLGREIVVFEVPGHDEGQIALAPRTMEWFLAGDLIQTIGTVVIQAPEGNMQKYFDTLKRVIDLNPKNIIPSHGIIIGGTNKIEDTLKHRQMRENQIIEYQIQNKTIDEMILLIYPNLETHLIPFAKRTIEAHLAKINNQN